MRRKSGVQQFTASLFILECKQVEAQTSCRDETPQLKSLYVVWNIFVLVHGISSSNHPIDALKKILEN